MTQTFDELANNHNLKALFFAQQKLDEDETIKLTQNILRQADDGELLSWFIMMFIGILTAVSVFLTPLPRLMPATI